MLAVNVPLSAPWQGVVTGGSGWSVAGLSQNYSSPWLLVGKVSSALACI